MIHHSHQVTQSLGKTSTLGDLGVYHVLQTLGLKKHLVIIGSQQKPTHLRSLRSRYDWKTREMQLWKWEKMKNEKKQQASVPIVFQDYHIYHLMRWSLGQFKPVTTFLEDLGSVKEKSSPSSQDENQHVICIPKSNFGGLGTHLNIDMPQSNWIIPRSGQNQRKKHQDFSHKFRGASIRKTCPTCLREKL